MYDYHDDSSGSQRGPGLLSRSFMLNNKISNNLSLSLFSQLGNSRLR